MLKKNTRKNVFNKQKLISQLFKNSDTFENEIVNKQQQGEEKVGKI